MCYSIYGNIELEEAMQKSSQILSLYNGLKLLENFGLELNKFYPDFLQFVDFLELLKQMFFVYLQFDYEGQDYINEFIYSYCIHLDCMFQIMTFKIDPGILTILKRLMKIQTNTISLLMFTK